MFPAVIFSASTAPHPWQKRFAVRVKYDKKDKKQTTHPSVVLSSLLLHAKTNKTHDQCCQTHKHMTLKSRFCSESVKLPVLITKLTSDSLTRCLYDSAVKDHFKIKLYFN